MLTITALTQRIEAIEAEELGATDSQLSAWLDILTFHFWRQPFGDNWHEAWQALPHTHPIKLQCSHITWLVWQFNDLLTGPPDGWHQERLQLAISFLLGQTIADGFTFDQLATTEAMREVFQIVDVLMNNPDNWTAFYEQKRFEANQHEKRHLFRGQFHRGELTPEACEWLKQFDVDFLEHNRMKQQSTDIDDMLKRLMAVTKPTLPLQSDPARLSYVQQRVEAIQNPPPIVQPEPMPTNGPVNVQFNGGQPDGSFSIMTTEGVKAVKRGEVYSITLHQLELLQEHGRVGDWVRV